MKKRKIRRTSAFHGSVIDVLAHAAYGGALLALWSLLFAPFRCCFLFRQLLAVVFGQCPCDTVGYTPNTRTPRTLWGTDFPRTPAGYTLTLLGKQLAVVAIAIAIASVSDLSVSVLTPSCCQRSLACRLGVHIAIVPQAVVAVPSSRLPGEK